MTARKTGRFRPLCVELTNPAPCLVYTSHSDKKISYPIEKIDKSNSVVASLLIRAALLLCAVLAGLVLLLAALLAVLDEADYERALVWSADYFLDSELHFTGPLSVRYSQGVLLSADALRLHARDSRYSLETNAFSMHFSPASVLSGALRIDELMLGDLVVKINEPDDGRGAVDFDIPRVTLASAQVNSLVVEYQEAAPGTLHRLTLDNFSIEDVKADGSVEIQAGGMFEGQAFRLVGLLPPLATMQDRSVSKPVRLDLASDNINATLEGTVTDPHKDEGLDFSVRANVKKVDPLLEILADDIPTLGSLEFSALLRGDITVPRLEDIDLRLQRDGRVELTVSGDVANAITGDGARLHLRGQTDNPQLLSWLLFRQQERLSSISLNAQLEKKNSRYFISGLDVKAMTPEGLNLVLGGSGEIFSAGHELGKRAAGFSVAINAPTTGNFYMSGRRKFPDFGGVAGTAAMAVSLDAVGLHDIDVSIGSRRGTHLLVQGDAGYIPLVNNEALRKTALRLNLKTVDTAALGRQFSRPWPDLGGAELAGDIAIRRGELRLDNARFIAGKPDRPVIKASGSLATVLNRGSTLDFDFDVTVADLLAAVSDIKPAYLGHVEGKTTISDMDGSWGIEKISLVSASTGLYRLKLGGHYDDVGRADQGNLKASIAVDDMASFGKAIGVKLPASGPLGAEGTLLADKGTFSYQGNASLGRTSGVTSLAGVLRNGKPQLQGKLELPTLHLADFGLAGEGGLAGVKRRPHPRQPKWPCIQS